jgi:hypothetical protein
MRHETRLAITNEWNRSSVAIQGELIREFLKKHGRTRHDRSLWLSFLAEQFGIFDLDFSCTHKTEYYKALIA